MTVTSETVEELIDAIDSGFLTHKADELKQRFEQLQAALAASRQREAEMTAALEEIDGSAPQDKPSLSKPSLSLYLRSVDYAQAYGAWQVAEIAREALAKAAALKAAEGEE